MKIKITSILQLSKLFNLVKEKNLSIEEINDVIFYSRTNSRPPKELYSLLINEVSRQEKKKIGIKF